MTGPLLSQYPQAFACAGELGVERPVGGVESGLFYVVVRHPRDGERARARGTPTDARSSPGYGFGFGASLWFRVVGRSLGLGE